MKFYERWTTFWALLLPRRKNKGEVAALVDAGRIKTTLTEVAGPIDAATLKKAHALLETGKARGKVVLEGF